LQVPAENNNNERREVQKLPKMSMCAFLWFQRTVIKLTPTQWMGVTELNLTNDSSELL
jgi:hypothetical protein